MNSCLIENIVEYIVELYNKLHGVESRARVIEVHSNLVKIEFSGSFCHTCGVRDWVEDFAYLALTKGCDVRLVEYIEPEDDMREYKRLGIFEISCNITTAGDPYDN